MSDMVEPGIRVEYSETVVVPLPSQAFFAAEAKSLRTPHFGERQKEWMVALLKRAQEAGIYYPEKP